MSRSKKVYPIRTCVVCRKQFEKNQLMRYVWDDEENLVVVDTLHSMSGRGAYCCNDVTCRQHFLTRKQGWKRAFRLN